MQNNEVKEILDRLNIPMNKSCACCLEDYECKTLGTNTDEFISKKMKISYTININIEYEN